MRSESGVNLVSGALQSSLARAQKNYQFHAENSSYNSEDKKQIRKDKKLDSKLNTYCDSIGSKLATSSLEQLIEQGRKLKFDDSGFLPPSITDELKDKYLVLKDNVGPPQDVSLPSYPSATDNKVKPFIKKEPSTIVSVKGKTCDTPKIINGSDSGNNINNNNKKTVVGGKKLDNRTTQILLQLKDKTIGKNKRKQLFKKLKKLKKLNQNKITATDEPQEATSVDHIPEITLPVPPVVFKDPKRNKLSNLASNLGNFSVQPIIEVKALLKKGKKKMKESMGPDAAKNGESSVSNGNGTSNSNHQLPQPKKILFPKEKIELGWRQKRGPGVGFHNFGNTCYLNSSLQALFHIPAFVNWIQTEDEHKRLCNGNSQQPACIICVVASTLQEHTKSNTAIRPRVLDKLKAICKHFSYGRQEDAHEFLRYLLEGMERSYLTAINGLRLDNRTKETNPLGQIFGGYIRTEVTCLKCHFVSTTFQPSAELQLDIRHVTTLEDALQQHFRKERLDNNDYKCEKCRTISQATKQFSLEVPPLVLCLQLKRFTLYGTKISKRIHCNKFLNMSKYLHKSRKDLVLREQDLKYRLVALVTHMGQSPNCGHYTAIAEGANGMYYQFDDQFVYQVSQTSALNNDAYVIIYEMDRNSRTPTTENSSAVSASSMPYSGSSFGSPSLKSSDAGYSPSKALTNGGTPSGPKKYTIPFAKKTNGESALRTSVMSPSATVTSASPAKTNGSMIGPTAERKAISFEIPKTLVTSSTSSPNKINLLKPGVSLTNSSKIFGPSAVTSLKAAVTTKSLGVKLVPYNDIDNDESDKEEQVPVEEKPKAAQKDERVENKKDIIGPVLQNPSLVTPVKTPMTPPKTPTTQPKKTPVTQLSPIKAPITPPKSPTPSPMHVANKVVSKSPEKQFGVKRKLDEILGATNKSNSSLKNLTNGIEEEVVLNATSKWTIVSNKTTNGYSSDPESKHNAMKKAKSSNFSRAKSMERSMTSSVSEFSQKTIPALVPNTKESKSSNLKSRSSSDLVVSNGISKHSADESKFSKQNGHHSHSSSSSSLKKRKRSRSRSSSISSSSSDTSPAVDSTKKRRKKHTKKKDKKKEKHLSSTNSGSESNNGESDTSSSRRKSKKKSKKKKSHKKRDDSEEDSSVKREDSKTRSSERETASQERDRMLRLARNPSRSPHRTVDAADGVKEKFDPNKINDREKSIVGWNGQQTVLSKSLNENRRRLHEKTKDELMDEEFDQGRAKKQRKSRSPSREGEGSNKFQVLQDRTEATKKWSSLLNGYGDGFKDHKISPSGKKPWGNKRSDQDEIHPRQSNSDESGGFRNSRPYSSSSGGYHRPGGGHKHFNGNRHHHNDKDKHWKHKGGHR